MKATEWISLYYILRKETCYFLMGILHFPFLIAYEYLQYRREILQTCFHRHYDVWTCGYMNQYIKLVERYLDSELHLGTLVWATQSVDDVKLSSCFTAESMDSRLIPLSILQKSPLNIPQRPAVHLGQKVGCQSDP